MPIFYQLSIGEEAEKFTSVHQLANAVARVHSKLNAMKAEISTNEQLIVVHQAVPEAVTSQSSLSLALNKCFNHHYNNHHSIDCREAELPAASGRGQISDSSLLEGTNVPFQQQIDSYEDREGHKSRATSTNQNDFLE
uniref:Uncharacterized protein n=1 Tax=Romanomermis culicivorax TaxID=13658 RepID=A0A915IK64_ROMCU